MGGLVGSGVCKCWNLETTLHAPEIVCSAFAKRRGLRETVKPNRACGGFAKGAEET